MKDTNNRLFLGLAALGGAAAAVLRICLLRFGLDEKGLLVSGSIYSIGLWILCGAFVVGTYVLLNRRLGGNGSYQDSFTPCRLRFALSALGGLVLGFESLRQLGMGNILPGVLGVLAALGMIAGGIYRLKGVQPIPLFHILVCVFFIARLVMNFQNWSADPQFQDYSLQLLACVSLMLYAFHRASCDANLVARHSTAGFGLYSAFFCLASLSDGAMPLLYLAGGLWAVGSSPRLEQLPEEAEEA